MSYQHIEIYQPAEDSYLLTEQVKLHAKGKVLEIGTGSGIQAFTAANSDKVDSVLAVDINPKAISYSKTNSAHSKITYLVSNLFENISLNNNLKFDTIIFNPPYLPYDPDEPVDSALATTGGKKGYELIESFLNQINDYLSKDGYVLLLFSSLSKKSIVEDIIKRNLLDFTLLSSTKISFEELFVYKINKNYFNKELTARNITNLTPLSHGHRGLIYTGLLKENNEEKKVTIKLQRQDIGAMGTVNNEINILKKINPYSVGPKLLFYGVDYFVYDFIDGIFMLDFFDKSTTSKENVITILENVLNQMRVLDSLGLNKEEMHHPLKHILITKDNKPVLIDFERCKHKEKLHNVTQFIQFLLSGHLEPAMKRFEIDLNRDKCLKLAKEYSDTLSEFSFKKILDIFY